MVVFAGEAYLQCPLTLEHRMISDMTGEVDFESVHVDGTAIGDAIALATARMMDSKAKSRVILLVTDGDEQPGQHRPGDGGEGGGRDGDQDLRGRASGRRASRCRIPRGSR